MGIAWRISSSSSGVTVSRPRDRANPSTRSTTTPRTNDGIRSTRARAAGDHASKDAGALP